MNKRLIKNINDLSFQPFDNYGEPVKGMSWHKLSYDKSKGGFGTYILKMEAGAKSLAHIHQGYEEFYVIDGELQDADGKIFKKYDRNLRGNGNTSRFRFLQQTCDIKQRKN